MTLSSRIHAIIDYILAAFLFISPALFALPYTSSVVIYGLAIIHLVLTICTNFKYALVKFIPPKIHGLVELAASVLLVPAAFYLKNIDGYFSWYFCLGLAILLFIFWLFSDYTNKPSTREIPYVESNTDGGLI